MPRYDVLSQEDRDRITHAIDAMIDKRPIPASLTRAELRAYMINQYENGGAQLIKGADGAYALKITPKGHEELRRTLPPEVAKPPFEALTPDAKAALITVLDKIIKRDRMCPIDMTHEAFRFLVISAIEDGFAAIVEYEDGTHTIMPTEKGYNYG